jgi:hypothetical protein
MEEKYLKFTIKKHEKKICYSHFFKDFFGAIFLACRFFELLFSALPSAARTSYRISIYFKVQNNTYLESRPLKTRME